MSLDEEALQTVAQGGLMESEKWAAMVDPLLERLEYIVYNVFPMPRMPSGATTSSVPQLPSSTDPSALQLQDSNSIPSSSNKENALPTDLQTPPRPTASSAAATSPLSERVPNSQPPSFNTVPTNETLPTPLMLQVDSIKTAVKSLFVSKPPHTIQRLAELILYPSTHYRTLPAYLRALDRVVSVTSSAEVFPLQTEGGSASQPNGVANGGGIGLLFDHSPGSDESLGGALLTPIPWLSNATSFEDDMEEPGNEGAEAVSIAVQQEVHLEPPQLPQEGQPQEVELTTTTTSQEVTLPNQSATSAAVENETMGGTTSPTPADTEELPHARGPPVVGVEDMGLQDGKGVEMPLSNVDGTSDNNQDNDTTEKPAFGQNQESASQAQEGGKKDGDGDIPLADEKSAEKTQQSESGA